MEPRSPEAMATEFALLKAEDFNWCNGPDPSQKPQQSCRDISTFYEQHVVRTLQPRLMKMDFRDQLAIGRSELNVGRPLIKCIAEEALANSYQCLSSQKTSAQAHKGFREILEESRNQGNFFLTPESALFGRGVSVRDATGIRLLKIGVNERKALNWILSEDTSSLLIPEFLDQKKSGVTQFVPALRKRIADLLDGEASLPSSERMPEPLLRKKVFEDIVNEWELANLKDPKTLNQEQDHIAKFLGHKDFDAFIAYFDALPPDRYEQCAKQYVQRIRNKPPFPERKLEHQFALLFDHIVMDRILDPDKQRLEQALPLIELWKGLMEEGSIKPYERKNGGLLLAAVTAKNEALFPEEEFAWNSGIMRAAKSVRELIFVPKD